MRRLMSAIGGGALLLAALLLSLPGVRAVRADPLDGAVTPTQEGPMCRAGEPVVDPAAVDRVEQMLRAGAPGEAAPDVVVLNTRGYNYPRSSQVSADLAALAREQQLSR